MGYLDDIRGQPENLICSHDTFTVALHDVDLSAFKEGSLVFTGMGSSYFAAIPAACALRSAGRAAFALPAADLLEPGADYLAAAFVGISQSGRSSETVRGFAQLSRPRLALTNSGFGPLAEVANVALPICSEPDHAIAVLTYTASLAAAVSLAGTLGARTSFDAPRIADHMSRTLEESEPIVADMLPAVAGVECLDFAGHGPALASAAEGALLAREAVRIPGSALDTYQYLHGPLEVAEAGRAAILIGSAREVQLAADLAAYGMAVLLITQARVSPAENLWVIALPELPPVLAPLLEIVPIQLLTHHLAQARGLDAGSFRHEQRDTKLTEAAAEA